ncbi:GTP cyclohydrolase II RibA [Nonomuraea turkmeniaca]|uniref:GTP cyclohydrolase II RibA n=1 Tax=Nonomuraea turkmeniaca TaxID=103838 RepID=A0A5S4FJ26_9ACTN|nr:GTP cyclohydrolase II RibA [Nonomuraea turkmeniaca]TMR20738.1 GTP cyclohydrolase II RibA [Nonomuraea turkmeniaca]
MNARILEVSQPVQVTNALGEFALTAYLIAEGQRVDTHLALTHGNLTAPVPMRINSACLTSEVLQDNRCDCAWQMWESLKRFVSRGQGILTYHPAHEGRGAGLFQKIQSYALMDRDGLTTAAAFTALGEPPDSRDYSAATAILVALGIDEVELLSNNPNKIESLVMAGIRVTASERVIGRHNPAWRRYLNSKAEAFGHLIERA